MEYFDFVKKVNYEGEQSSNPLAFKFYDEKAGEWYLENEYTFYVGQDSADAMNNKLTVSV